MADRTFTYDEAVAAFRESGHWWRSLVGGIEDHQWDLMALGEWNVRELVAHTGRAFKTVAEYVGGEVKDTTPVGSAAEYFRIVLAEQTPHVHIAARATAEAAAETDWVTATDRLWAASDLVVSRSTDETVAHLFVGEMRLAQYLATRVVELVVHGTDLSEAISLPSHPPVTATRMALAVLVDLSTGDDLGAMARMLTGRDASAGLSNVLA